MMVKPSLGRQALAGVLVLVATVATLLGGFLIVRGEGSLVGVVDRTETPTPYRLPTLPVVVGTEAAPAGSPEETAEVLPTVTPTPVVEPSPSAPPTVTPLPTATRRVDAIAATSTARITQSAAATTCVTAEGWIPYTVQPGETLYSIGLRYRTTVTTMQRGNCLTSASISAGQVILVPPSPPPSSGSAAQVPPAPTIPAAVSDTSVSVGPVSTGPQAGTTDGACLNAGSVITSPRVGAVLNGQAAFYGSATDPDFQFYKLEVRQEGASARVDFVTAYTSTQPVSGGLLGTINTAAFPNGEYWVRLMVVDNSGNWIEPCSILYYFQN